MREPARRRWLDDVVGAFVIDCRARNLSPKTISSYLEGIASFRASLETEPASQTLAELTLEAGRAWAADLPTGGSRRPSPTGTSRSRCSATGARRSSTSQRTRWRGFGSFRKQ